MAHNPREISKLEQEAMEHRENDQKARSTVEEALQHSIPQQRYQQMRDQQDLNGK